MYAEKGERVRHVGGSKRASATESLRAWVYVWSVPAWVWRDGRSRFLVFWCRRLGALVNASRRV